MGFLEATVVVYLRLHYYPDGFTFPLAVMPPAIAAIEVAREVATIVMLGAVGYLAGSTFLPRFASFCIAFGIWDIFYYVFLKLLLNWPASLLTDDILFLIPSPWIGPVLAPVIVSLCLITAGLIILVYLSRNKPVVFSAVQWVFIALGGLLVLESFLLDTGAALHQQDPAPFGWYLFAAGMLVGLAAFVGVLRKQKTPGIKPPGAP
jgi:hypothetical protein